MFEGKCECEKVQFQVTGDVQELSHCHCSQCRRLHGAAFATFATVNRREFSFVTGEAAISQYASSAEITRLFCSSCGSTIAADAGEPGHLYVSMSIVRGEPKLPAAYHEFVGSKAHWYEILDDAPRYEKGIT